jgi:hypothetical protein
MKNAGIFTIALTGVLLTSMAALADQGKPLRHLVYRVGVTVSTQTSELTMGENGDMPTGGSGVANYNGGMLTKGTMTADVLGLTPDNALAIRISEDTDNRKAPPVRVDVMSDGALRIPPDQALIVTQEEQTLLRMLARDFLNADDLNAGQWARQVAQDKANMREVYRVTGTQPNGDVSIALDQAVKVEGAQPSDTTTHGTITYSSKYKVPRSVSLDGRTHREGIQQTETNDSKLTLELVSDSFQSGS